MSQASLTSRLFGRCDPVIRYLGNFGFVLYFRSSIITIHLLMLATENRTHFLRWAVIGSSFIPQKETHLIIPGFGEFQIEAAGNVCVAEQDSNIILVNRDRVLYELDLTQLNFKENTLASPRSGHISHQPYCKKGYQLSSHGHRLVAYCITCPELFGSTESKCEDGQSTFGQPRKARIEVRSIDLSGPENQMQRIELEYTEPYLPGDGHHHVLTFSPDLSMVRAGSYILDLQAPENPPLSLPTSLLKTTDCQWGVNVSFSSCGAFITVTTSEDVTAAGKTATFELFRICRAAGRLEQIVIKDLADLVSYAISVAFHPTLSLLLLTCITCRASDIKCNPTAIKVLEIDLHEIKPVPIVIPKHNLLLYHK